MPRYALKVEYDGSPFCGWQRQQGQPSVQQSLEEALRRLDASVPTVIAAGRTDTGVHASGQVAHCEMQRAWDPARLAGGLNFHLRPAPVAILACAIAPPEFHARFSAVERRYTFRLLSRSAPAVLDRGKVWQIGHALDLTAMQKASTYLLGKHDFTTFRASQCQAASAIKTMDEVRIESQPVPYGVEFRFHFRARSFLHSQIRSIVGSLERVGAGGWTPEDLQAALNARNRAACGPVCPPQGLYLTGVGYPVDPFRQA